MAEAEIEEFLTHLAMDRKVASSTQNQAFSALLFLYREVLGKELVQVNAKRSRRPKRIPVVLTTDEIQTILAHLDGVHYLMASLLYGAGLRLMECLRLRVKDVDFKYQQITIRSDKSQMLDQNGDGNTYFLPLIDQSTRVQIRNGGSI